MLASEVAWTSQLPCTTMQAAPTCPPHSFLNVLQVLSVLCKAVGGFLILGGGGGGALRVIQEAQDCGTEGAQHLLIVEKRCGRHVLKETRK